MKFNIELLDRFIPQNLREDRRTLMQARMLIAILLTGLAARPVVGIMALLQGTMRMAYFEVGYEIALIGVLFLLKKTASMRVAGNAALVVTGAGFVWPVTQAGGLHSSLALLFLGYPLVAFLIVGRMGALWCAAMAVATLAIGLTDAGATNSGGGVDTAYLGMFLATLVSVSVVSFLFEAANASGFKALEEERRNAESLAQQVKRLLAEITSALSTADNEGNAIASHAAQIADSMTVQVQQVGDVSQHMEALHQHASENMQRSIAAAEEAGAAGQQAATGGKVMGETIADMRHVTDTVGDAAAKIEELTRRSDEIGNIVAVIKEVADQTNLLALNAAIEAARAGEQGRGFAVVADEVRKLAERTQSSTGEIGKRVASILEVTQQAKHSMSNAAALTQKSRDNAVRADETLRDVIKHAESVAETLRAVAQSQQQQTQENARMTGRVVEIGDAIRDSHQATNAIAEATKRLEQEITALSSAANTFKAA